MRWVFGLVGAALTAISADPAVAGGNLLAITRVRGQVQIKSVKPGARWQAARPGVFYGTYLLRTGPRSSVRLQEQGAWVPRRLDRACVDANSLLRVQSPGCGFHLDVLQGQVSAADGKRGKSRFKRVGG